MSLLFLSLPLSLPRLSLVSISLFLCLSLFLTLSYIYLSVYVYPSRSLPLCRCIPLSRSLSLSLSLSLSVLQVFVNAFESPSLSSIIPLHTRNNLLNSTLLLSCVFYLRISMPKHCFYSRYVTSLRGFRNVFLLPVSSLLFIYTNL